MSCFNLKLSENKAFEIEFTTTKEWWEIISVNF